jgi:GAF domain-containing protein
MSDAVTELEQLALSMHGGARAAAVWEQMDRSLASVYGHRLFTVLAYDETTSLLSRVYSTRPDINPPGGRKRVTESPWKQSVLREGKILVRSTREDIKSLFSEYEVLWSIGCESVLNIPIRKNGVTVGSMNLLDGAGHYDAADISLAYVFGQLAIAPLEASMRDFTSVDMDNGKLEHV